MNKNLIFDIGFNDGTSSKDYLKNNYTVVGVECNPKLIKKCNIIYNKEINEGKLILIEKCISDDNDKVVKFYVDILLSVWGSTNKEIANRERPYVEYNVKTITLKQLIEQYGTPIYCKIDIEGDDIIAIETLKDVVEKPKYISCETECVGKDMHDSITGLEVINKLKELGYTKYIIYKNSVGDEFHFDLNKEYEWVDYETICEQLIEKRKKHDFSKGSWTFWYDVCATF